MFSHSFSPELKLLYLSHMEYIWDIRSVGKGMALGICERLLLGLGVFLCIISREIFNIL